LPSGFINFVFKKEKIMKKFAVVLAGCGVYDGAEIHEAVLTLLAIEKAGAKYHCFAPDIPQHHVVDHLTGRETAEERNVLAEAARIARGRISPLSEFRADGFDALIFPGGFGAAKNLCNWAILGDQCTVNPDVEMVVKAMARAGKPIGAMCISPVVLARLFQDAMLTTGHDPASAGFIEKTGNRYVATGHGEVVADRERRLFTTPCYMLDATISQIAEGTEKLVNEMMNE
jgi:enhancing lycopene biosynthesis protein 2